MAPQLFLTLKQLDSGKTLAGFNNGVMEIKVYYDETIEKVLNNLNNYRTTDNQIKILFNEFGKQINNNAMKIKIKENIYLSIKNKTKKRVIIYLIFKITIIL